MTIQRQLRAFREAVSMKYKTEIGPEPVLMGWMVRHCAWVGHNFLSEGNRENALIVLPGARTTLEKLCQLEKCAWGEKIGGWHEMDARGARSFCRQA